MKIGKSRSLHVMTQHQFTIIHSLTKDLYAKLIICIFVKQIVKSTHIKFTQSLNLIDEHCYWDVNVFSCDRRIKKYTL